VGNDEDFAAMFEASLKTRQFSRGQAVEGTIVAIGPKVAFVDVGGKGEAEIDVAELKDADGALELAVGDLLVRWENGQARPAKVIAINKTDKLTTVFNLVLEDQDFYISGGFQVRSKPPLAPEAVAAAPQLSAPPEPTRRD